MIETSATNLARELHEFLRRVEQGETVRILRHGRAVARLVPDHAFMSGRRAADLFRGHNGNDDDRAAADAIEAEIRKLDQEQENALDH